MPVLRLHAEDETAQLGFQGKAQGCHIVGNNDYESLHLIYSFADRFSKLMNYPYHFKIDSGNFETAIIIDETGSVERPKAATSWKTLSQTQNLFVPDILDFENKIIIEYDELEGEPRSGAKLAKKGHNADGLDKRTANRDLYYGIAKFHVLKIFDSDDDWREKTVRFLMGLKR